MSKKTGRERSNRTLDRELDRDLEATFPASDPLKITRHRPRQPKLTAPKRHSAPTSGDRPQERPRVCRVRSPRKVTGGPKLCDFAS
jgi:hypothetical protein